VSIGYCSLGVFNGSNELYVPFGDGTLQILDAATLQMKEKIYVGGINITSVVYFSGKLYATASDFTDITNQAHIKIYDRATKTLANRAGGDLVTYTRLILLEGTSGEMIENQRSRLAYYQFSADGKLLEEQITPPRSINEDLKLIRSFPDGSKFIISENGSIFNKSLTFDRKLQTYLTYSDYAFNNDGSIIYAAKGDPNHKIEAISYPDLSTIKSYNTILPSIRIFRDGDTLISLGRSSQNDGTTYLLIEKINL
jgi:hypothetical protein